MKTVDSLKCIVISTGNKFNSSTAINETTLQCKSKLSYLVSTDYAYLLFIMTLYNLPFQLQLSFLCNERNWNVSHDTIVVLTRLSALMSYVFDMLIDLFCLYDLIVEDLSFV